MKTIEFEAGHKSLLKILDALSIDWKQHHITRVVIDVCCDTPIKIYIHRTLDVKEIDKLCGVIADIPHKVVVDER